MTDERRIVTILLADVADSTALGEELVQVADACGAGALLPRVRYETARARRDDAGMEAALRAPEAMGDRALPRLSRQLPVSTTC